MNKKHKQFHVRGIPLSRLELLAEINKTSSHQMLMKLIMSATLEAPEKKNDNYNLCK